MKWTKTIPITILVVFTMISKIYSQCCSGGVPISGSLGLSSSDAKSWQFLLTYNYNVMNDLFEANHSLDDKSRERITHSTILEGNYGLTKRITLTGMLSFIRQERTVKTIVNQTDFTYTQGLGDGIFLFKYRLVSPEAKPNYSLSIGAGPKIPIGRTDFTNQNGLALSADMQPGSGAWDMMLWSNFERYHIFRKNFNLAAVLTYRNTGKNKDYFGMQDYRFGNEFTFNLQSSYRFFIRSLMLDGLITFRYRSQREDFVDGQEFPNSGGNFIYIIPGLNYNASTDLAFLFDPI